MLTALTPTPRTSVRSMIAPSGAAARSRLIAPDCSPASARGRSYLDRDLRLDRAPALALALRYLLLDPAVGASDPFLQADLWLPAEHLAQAGIVRVAPAHALGTRDVNLLDGDAGRIRDHVGQLVDGDQAVLAEVERLVVVRAHEAVDALHAVVDVAERPRLLTIPPDLHLRIPGELGDGDLAAHGSRSLFTTAVPGA